ncbi:hypothetical protein JST56_00625 [Candidatus Dependentiae bacterium]|jgi:septal ring factor EnvC (AmiA/AmiB activator)|nr:hypothetical protein [Candidatus Dependentiae bacterium]
MKKLLAVLLLSTLAGVFISHARHTLFAAIPTPLLVPPQANPQLTEEQAQKAFEAQIRNAQNKLEPLMRQVKFAHTDLGAIKRALEQSKNQVDRINQDLGSLKQEQEKLRTKVSTHRQNLVNVQRIFKELREKQLSVTSEARQRAAEAQRLARSTSEIENSSRLAHMQEASIKNSESQLTAMQNQLNKIEVIAAALGK